MWIVQEENEENEEEENEEEEEEEREKRTEQWRTTMKLAHENMDKRRKEATWISENDDRCDLKKKFYIFFF